MVRVVAPRAVEAPVPDRAAMTRPASAPMREAADTFSAATRAPPSPGRPVAPTLAPAPLLVSPAPAPAAPRSFLGLPVEVQKLVVRHLGARDAARIEDAAYGAHGAPAFWEHRVEPLRAVLGGRHPVAAHTVRSLLFVGLPPQVAASLGDDVRRALVGYLRPFAEDVPLVAQLCSRPFLCREVRAAAYGAYNLTMTPLRQTAPRRAFDDLADGLQFVARAFARRSEAGVTDLDAALALLARELEGDVQHLALHRADVARGRRTCLLSLSARCEKLVLVAEKIGGLAEQVDAVG